MKKFIALLIAASIMVVPAAFAADESAGNADAAMQPAAGNDQAASDATAKPAGKKAHRPCHCKGCKHKHHTSSAKKPAAATQE